MPKRLVSQSDIIEWLLITSGCQFAGVRLTHYSYMRRQSGRFSRNKQLATRDIANLIDRSRSGECASIQLLDREFDVNQSTAAPLFLAAVDSAGNEPYFTMDILCPSEIYRQTEFSDSLRSAVQSLRPSLGYVTSGSQRTVQSLLSCIPVSKPGEWDIEELDPAERRLWEELFYYQRYRDQIGERVTRAHWGSILNADHVRRLGGEAAIRRLSGCALVERWEDRLYLQATSSPWEVPPQVLKDLNQFLAPIRIPGAPEPDFTLH